MKKLFSIALVSICLISCKNEEEIPNGTLHLTGNIKGLSQGKVYIHKITDSGTVPIDSIFLKGNSQFESKIKLLQPEMLLLVLDRGETRSIDNQIPFFAEAGKMNIETNLKEFYAGAKITGSKNQDLLTDYNLYESKFNEKNLELIKLKLEKGKEINKTTLDSIHNEFEKLTIRKYRYTANFAATHANHEVAPYLALTKINNINIAYLDTIIKKMPNNIARSKYGVELRKLVSDRKKDESIK